ncbi:hypothetical protein Y1Q_0000506 [Alligator mississippiensis]|uniref:Uncharacterized protein n=1 Tax=Alligator mississippiensis TaxID=8496 RepID=A0A151MBN5_ALLMI|nr:hypothetical protein Y1Q_0000506 [Alligator mississippiensis]
MDEDRNLAYENQSYLNRNYYSQCEANIVRRTNLPTVDSSPHTEVFSDCKEVAAQIPQGCICCCLMYSRTQRCIRNKKDEVGM